MVDLVNTMSFTQRKLHSFRVDAVMLIDRRTRRSSIQCRSKQGGENSLMVLFYLGDLRKKKTDDTNLVFFSCMA